MAPFLGLFPLVFGSLLFFCLSQVPIFVISETAEEIFAFTNALPEWLCKSRQEKVIHFD
jgi:hypothetical protein